VVCACSENFSCKKLTITVNLKSVSEKIQGSPETKQTFFL